MAYRPPIFRGSPIRRNPGPLVRRDLERQALVMALARRLAMILAAMPGRDRDEGAASPLPGRDPRNPIFGPRPPLRPNLVPVPRPTGPPGAMLAPTIPVQGPPAAVGEGVYLPSDPPPSAFDWRRLPGFYESDRPLPGDRY